MILDECLVMCVQLIVRPVSKLVWLLLAMQQGKHCFLSVVVALVVAVVVVAVAVVASDWELGTAVAEGVLI